MSHIEITSVLLLDARNKNLNAACGLAMTRDGIAIVCAFFMRGRYNPYSESITPLLSKVLNQELLPNARDVITFESNMYILSSRGMSSAIPTSWWSIWQEHRGKPYAVLRRDVSPDDMRHKCKLAIRVLHELLDDYPHLANWWKWVNINLRILCDGSDDAKLICQPI